MLGSSARVFTFSRTTAGVINTAAEKELFIIQPPAGIACVVLFARWWPVSSEDPKQLETRLRILSNTTGYTADTTNFSARPHAPGIGAHGCTLFINETLSTAEATDGIIDADSDDQRNGYLYRPQPEEWCMNPANAIVALSLMEAPTAAIDIRFAMRVALIG